MSLLKCLTFLALLAALDAARFKCEYTFYKDARGYIKFQEMPLTFDNAKKECATEGGILASPINDGIKAATMSITKTNKVKSAVFTGFSAKSNRRAIFSSVEGIRLSEINHTWAPNEPDNYQDKENCIAMLPDGTLADVNCDEPRPNFCFLHEAKAKKLSVCGAKEYTFDTTTGSCYKFHGTKLEYHEAVEICEGEEGYLLIINGDNEAQAIKNFCSENSIVEESFVGFRYNKDSGEWVTLQGQTLEEAGYEKWAPREPNNKFGKEYCASVYPGSALFNDVQCEAKYAFICEKDPKIIFC